MLKVEELIVCFTLIRATLIVEVGLFFNDTINDRMSVVKARTDCRTRRINLSDFKSLIQNRLKSCYPYLLETLVNKWLNVY